MKYSFNPIIVKYAGNTKAELKEINAILTNLTKKVEGMNGLIEERLIGCEDPLPEEIDATKEYEAAKENKTVELIP